MKILQIINSLATGGAEKLLLETIPLYQKAGIDMDVLLLWDGDCLFAQKLKELNCCTIFISIKSNNHKDIYNPIHVLRIRKIIKQYDVIHVHLFPALYYTAFANIGIGKKLIFTDHSTNNRRINHWFLSKIDRFIYSRYLKIIGITSQVRSQLQDRLNNPEENIIIINNGIDLKKSIEAQGYTKSELNLDLPEKVKLIIQVSSFRYPKDQKTLIKALENLPNYVHLLLVGDGVLLEETKKIVSTLHLSERVHFFGNRSDVPQLLKTADIIVLSSHYEGLSLSSIEGMASRRPFIASNVPGLAEIVGGAGVLFECGYEIDLANNIQKLIENTIYYDEIAEKCVERAKQFDIKIMIEKHIELYKTL